MFKTSPWEDVVLQQLTADTSTALLLRAFTLPQGLIFPTFRVLNSGLSAGTAAVFVRFGFTDADIVPPPLGQGIDFAGILAAGASDVRSPVWGGTSAIPLPTPDFTGNELSILPPRVNVFVTTLGFTGFLTVSYTGIIVP